MSKESYIRGFCKAAEAKGVDPKALADFMTKSAQNGIVREGPTTARAKFDEGFSKAMESGDVATRAFGGGYLTNPSWPLQSRAVSNAVADRALDDSMRRILPTVSKMAPRTVNGVLNAADENLRSVPPYRLRADAQAIINRAKSYTQAGTSPRNFSLPKPSLPGIAQRAPKW